MATRHGVLRQAAAAAGAALSLAAAAGAELPIPKVMSDAPAGDGKWRMEMLQAPGGAKAPDMSAAGGGMMVCTTAAKAMAGDDGRKAKSDCRGKLLEDSASRAVMELHCPGDGTAMRTTITRVAARAYEMTAQDLKKPDEAPMRARMSYVGPCAAGDSVMSYDKDSPMCRQMRAQLGEIDKARASCAGAGADRAACEQMVDRQRAQITAMCGG